VPAKNTWQVESSGAWKRFGRSRVEAADGPDRHVERGERSTAPVNAQRNAVGMRTSLPWWGFFLVIMTSPAQAEESGLASIYGYSGSRTASGERARLTDLTAAHRSLPFGTKVRVTNQRNGRSVVVRINDRGPFRRGRVIDITPAAARELGFSGVASVSLAVVD
jgi:rare lipoprotein A